MIKNKIILKIKWYKKWNDIKIKYYKIELVYN